VANRACPLCFVNLPAALLLTRSDDFECPSCHAALEVSRFSRVTASVLGLLAACGAALLCGSAIPEAGWVAAVPVAFLAYGCIAALFVHLCATVSVRPRNQYAFPQIHK
jgi:membrane protein YdbS with pleckstrin-like domain